MGAFGDELRARRTDARMTQHELARRAGVSVRAVRNIEQGKVTARPETARRLTEAIGPRAEPIALHIGVLGTLTVHCGTERVEIGPTKQRTLLGLLALQAGRVVGRADIVDVLWGEHPPATHVNLVHTYVMRLRAALGQPSRQLINRVRTGYQLDPDAARLDVVEFEHLVASAAAADPQAALDLYARALACWRGPVQEGLSQHPAAVALAHRRLSAAMACADIALDLGRYEPITAHLRELCREEPLHEGLHARLMLTTAGMGAQSAALEVYTGIRHRLVTQLGIEPGAALQDAYLRILRQEVPEPQPGTVRLPVPAQLPGHAAGFLGRAPYLDRLDGLSQTGDESTAITVITGTAGVGKTALALHWARRAKDRFPDGQLYVDLCGYGPEQPVSPADALSGFLRALGVHGTHVPSELVERSARFRTLVEGKRILVVLDNAGTAEQVRPLLPGTSSSHVLITSRDTLAGLVVRDGARRLGLELLSMGEALALLRSLIGERVDAEPEGAEALASQCVRLPLAVRLAAELSARRPAARLADLVEELSDEQRKLDALDAGGDAHTALRAVFSWSYQHLPGPVARLFRLMGLHPGHGISVHAAAALADLDLGTTRRHADMLAQTHLVEHTSDGRFHLHDLLRTYASELVAAVDGPSGARSALDRLLSHYLHTASLAMDKIAPYEPHRRPSVAPSTTPRPEFAGYDDAFAWLQLERRNLLATARLPDYPRHAGALSGMLFRYLDIGDHLDDAQTLHEIALTRSRQAGDTEGEAYALRGLTFGSRLRGRLDDALNYGNQALALAEATGRPGAIAASLNNLALVHWRLGDLEQAVRIYERALALGPAAPSAKARLRSNLGAALRRLGRHAEALDHLRFAVATATEAGDRDMLGYTLVDLAQVLLELGRHEDAREHNRHAMQIAESTGDRALAGEVCNGLGEIAERAGDHAAALMHFTQAVSLTGLAGDHGEESRAQEGMARALERLGGAERAETVQSHTRRLGPVAD